MIVTVELALMLRLVRILSERESKVKRDRVLASESENLPLKEESLIYIKVT